ncbi:MAG: porin [Ideonella sp.]|jgi:predicted porin|nr:porin [Ideonella sp.]
MKNLLSILSAVAALIAPDLARAQDTVTVFGVVDVGLARLTGSSASVNGVSTGGANISRLGFRGTEDMGGGLKAGFWLEAGMDVDAGAGKATGSALNFNRRSTVSVMGAFGEVRLGRDDAATFLSTLIFDPFLTNGVGGTMAFVMRTGAPLIQISNAVSYFLPASLGGFYGQVQHAFGEQLSGTANSSQGNYNGLRFGYRAGPLNAAFATGKLKGATSAADISLNNLGLSYDLGVVRPILLWATEKQGATKVSALQLGVVAPIGTGQLRAQYSRFNTNNSAVDWTKLAIGYGYDLSKRTALYGTVARVSNSSGAAKSIGVQGLAAPGTALGSSSSGYEVGIRHTF